jgi:pyrroline-5-carboxylate reductase
MSQRYPYKLAVIGGGMMGAALVRGFLARGLLQPGEILVSEIEPTRRQQMAAEVGVAVTEDSVSAAAQAPTIMLAVKPQVAPALLPTLRDSLSAGQLVVSIMAGLSLKRLRELIGEGPALVRVMPNLPATVQAAASAYALDAEVSAEQAAQVKELLSAVGVALRVEEKLMDAVTGLSGSGPAYVAVLIEALADGGVAARLPRQVAAELAIQTVLGAALLQALIMLALVVVLAFWRIEAVGWTAALFPLVLAPLLFLSLGAGWFFAAAGAFFRDIAYAVQILTQILLFASAVFFPVERVPAKYQWVMLANPLAGVLENGRRMLLRGQQPEWAWLLGVTGFSFLFMLAGYVFFMKSKRAFGDVV